MGRHIKNNSHYAYTYTFTTPRCSSNQKWRVIFRMSWWAVLLLESEVESHFECSGEWSSYQNLKSSQCECPGEWPPCYKNLKSRVITNVLMSGLVTRTWRRKSLQMSWWMALLQEPEVESHYECPDEWPSYKNPTSKVITNVLVSGLATRTRSRELLRMSWWLVFLIEPQVESHYECPDEWSCY